MRRAYGLAATIFAFLCGTLRSAEASCLPDAIPPEKRQGIANLNGDSEVPFGVWVHDWDSAWLAFHVVKVLAEEVLGYHTVVSGIGSSSNSGLYATAGCREPNNFAVDPECGDDPTFVHHATLEVWGVSKIATMEQKLAPWPQIVPEDAGNMGYEGIQGTFVFKEQKELAYQTEGLTLEYYRSYNANWKQPATYFDKISAFEPADLKPCNETWFTESEMMRIYLQVTGDLDGLVDKGDGNYIARCWNQSWWLAPACRNSPDSCVPFVTTALGWFMHDFMQRATRFNMPLALSVAQTNTHWKRVARDMKCLTYWWEPDLTFIDLHPSIITFPTYNALERAENIRLSQSDNTRLSKWVHNRLGLLASRLREFLFRVSITKESVNEMLLENKKGTDHEQVACDWVSRNEHIWRDWVPLKTSCIPGKGLVAENGSFVSIRDHADDCEWCPPGRFAAQHNDRFGTTYICVECSPGRSQPNPGQLECSACESGTFADTNASRECWRCPVGTFQNATSGVGCHECPATMTTVILGASTVSECTCPEGTYRPARSDLTQLCKPCPEGMECKAGSAEENIPSARGALPGGEHPKPLPMFYATYSEPLSVYMCMSPGRCPGGGFEACDEHSFGLVCGRCVSGYHRTLNSGCKRCSAISRSWWLIPVAVFVLGPIIACVLHKVSLVPLDKWGSPHSAVAAAGFLTLIYLQVIATVRTCYLLYPSLLADAIEWTAFSLEPLALHLSCSLAVDFRTGFLLQLFTPLVAFAVFAATFAASRMLERCNPNYHMDGHVMMGCYGSVYNTFFISIASHAFLLFQCYEHPNGLESLRSAPDVLCNSQTWDDLLVVAVIAILVFCGGALALYTYINYKAPLHFQEEEFRKKWHFLFMRFRPTVWWWSTCLLLRGIWINLATVIFKGGHLQLVWLTFVHMLYLVVCFTLLPWRAMSIGALDVGTHAVLLIFFALLPYFAHDDGQGKADQVMGVLSVICCASPLIGSCCVVATQIFYRFRPVSHEEQAHEMCATFSKAGTRDIAAVLQLLPTADIWALDATRHMLEAELLGTRISTKRLTFRPSGGSNPQGDASQSQTPPGTPRSTLSTVEHVKSEQSVHTGRGQHLVQLAV